LSKKLAFNRERERARIVVAPDGVFPRIAERKAGVAYHGVFTAIDAGQKTCLTEGSPRRRRVSEVSMRQEISLKLLLLSTEDPPSYLFGKVNDRLSGRESRHGEMARK
jgi:hypothetical protein